MRRPRVPEPTAAERAMQRRQLGRQDELTEEENRRRRLIMAGRMGTRALLSGAATGARAGGRGTTPATGGQAVQPPRVSVLPPNLRGLL